ncbi:basic proline-rich protein-like [Gadus macrocephalus]|uniref:basic proline-rich protein-like n=1 Tax=Gadus macrocephalus TaxID=80720 RepID=UPI0028CB928B|nr:basic proline-rich protein-like [Gadus macrocephalus]XP_059914536.1 basic proline-rich protein-like [Gadus macrocephalus]
MYPDAARHTPSAAPHRPPRPGGPCTCHGCARRPDPPDPRRHLGTGAGPRPPRDHPATPDGRRLAPGGDRAESHRSPQRRPVFAASGPYPDLPGYLSPGRRDPWDPRPAQWTHPGAPERPGARHYASVREQCGCVSRGGGGGGGGGGRPFNGTPSHTFNGRPPPPLPPPPPPEFRGQGDGPRRTSGGEEGEGGEGEGEEKPGEEGNGKQPRTGRERGGGGGAGRRRSEQHAGRPWTPPGHSRAPNGHPGRRVSSETRERGGRHPPDWSWRPLRVPEEGGYSVPGAAHRGFFSTEVPQKHLSYSRRKGPCVPSSPPTARSQGPSPSPSQDRPGGQGSDPPRAGAATVHEQIRQVVMNLEDVLGGLKQVHWEMKEVVDHIDRLTANMDLGDEGIAVTPGNEPADSYVPPRPVGLGPAPAPNPKPPSVQNHVFLRTNAPSPVHVASVVKTSRVPPPPGPPGAGDGAGRKRPQLVSNGHLPHLCPPRYSELQDPWRRGTDPEEGTAAGRWSPGPRTQKPPPYPQNGRCGKGPVPPPIPVKTQTPYPGRRGQNTSMV